MVGTYPELLGFLKGYPTEVDFNKVGTLFVGGLLN